MFTGLISETGKLRRRLENNSSTRFTILAPTTARQSEVGDSIAVNGCCLTVVERVGAELSFDLLAETLRKTSLSTLSEDGLVNIEPALTASAKMGGHFVQGHIDTTAAVLDYSAHGGDHRLEIELPEAQQNLIVYKGSIAIDGISLTVAEVLPSSFVCWIIPHTHTATNLKDCRVGNRVNLEFDILAKYVERMLALRLPLPKD